MCQMVLKMGFASRDRAFWNENKVSQRATADWGKFFALSQHATGQKKSIPYWNALKKIGGDLLFHKQVQYQSLITAPFILHTQQ